jgi:beta-glucanase (GH16 family)
MAAKGRRWKLVWSDEFDGDAVDATKWDFELGNGFFDYKSHRWVDGWGNEELQYYTREPGNVSVRDSMLYIRALKESLHGCGYTSARLRTRRRDGTPLFAQRYGKFEFRAKVPHGKGLWPALWLLPLEDKYGGWAASGEIDVMEIVGEKPEQYLGTVHFGSTFPKRELVTHVHKFPAGQSVADFHVYAVEWEPGEIRWLVDGKVWATQTFWWSCSRLRGGKGIVARSSADLNPWPAPFDQSFYIVMNVAVGGNFPGVPNQATQFPAELVVDYVRVYDRVGGYGATAPRGKGRLPYQKKR